MVSSFVFGDRKLTGLSESPGSLFCSFFINYMSHPSFVIVGLFVSVNFDIHNYFLLNIKSDDDFTAPYKTSTGS